MSGRLVIAASVVGAWLAVTAVPFAVAAADQQTSEPTTGTARGAESSQEMPGLPLRDAGGQDRPSSPSGTGGYVWQMMAYMLVFVALGFVAIVVIKKVLPRIGMAVPTGKRISTLETVYLGPRKTVHLLQVGTRKILLSGSREGLSMLADVTDGFVEHDDVSVVSSKQAGA